MGFYSDVVKPLVKAFGLSTPITRTSQEYKEEQKERLIQKFPVQSKGQGVLLERGMSVPVPNMWYEKWLDKGVVLAKVKLIDAETKLYSEVLAELELPKIEFPELNIPPYHAEDIRPVRELLERFMHKQVRTELDVKCAMWGNSFAEAVANAFKGKALTVAVMGVSDRIPDVDCVRVSVDCLRVSCDEINETIQRQFREFVSELEIIKSTFMERKEKDEVLLRQGAKVSGRVMLEEFSCCPGELSLFCDSVDVEGASVYSVRIKGERRFVPSMVADKIKELREFVVDSVDESSLNAIVSSDDVDRVINNAKDGIAMACTSSQMESPFIVRAASNEDTIEVFRKPLLIDGNNVVRYDKSKNWRVLKTLIDWLKKNDRDFFVYFDASIEYVEEHVEMDADGKAYLHALINDSSHAKKCPAGDEADKFILYEANNEGNHILSNDTYGQWEELYPWVKARNNSDEVRRVHRFQVKGDILSIPDLGVYEMVN